MVLSKLKQNIAALGSVQVANYLFPLITIPYLTRVLGVEAWGTLSWSQIVIGYFTLITNWGFSISGTRAIAANQSDSKKINTILSNAWGAQFFLSLCCVSILLLLIQFNNFFSNRAEFFYWGAGFIMTGVLFPIWFFNGMEYMRTVAMTQIITRATTLPLIFFLVNGPADAPRIIMIGMIQNLVGGLFAIKWMNSNMEMKWILPSISDIFQELKEGAGIFLSTIWIGLYTTLTPTMLGIIAGGTSVGFYSIADKTRMLAQTLLTPISQALFPRMSNLFAVNQTAAWALIRKSSVVIITMSALISALLFVAADVIVELLSGSAYQSSVPILRIMSILPFIISLSNIFGIQILLPNQQNNIFNRILFIAGMISLLLLYPLINTYKETGAAVNVLIVETFVTLNMGLFVLRLIKKNNLN